MAGAAPAIAGNGNMSHLLVSDGVGSRVGEY